MNMNSFYGGPNGQSFNVKQIFTSKNGLTNSLVNDLSKGWTSPISVGEFVVISYGMPNDPNFDQLLQIDLDKEGKSYNSTLWQKRYDKQEGLNANGLYYHLIASMTGNTPKIKVIEPAGVIDADEDPYLTYDNTNIDEPIINFYLPQSQVLGLSDTVILDANEMPIIEFDNGNEEDNAQPGFLGGTINDPMIRFSLPQSQFIKNASIEEYLNVGEMPQVRLDIDVPNSINRPELKFKLPQSQQFLPENVRSEELNADETPYITFNDTENVNKPILTFYLPQSQVMLQPAETIVIDPLENPTVQDVGSDVNINSPQLQFSIPRAVRFYYGVLLGKRQEGTYELTDESFADYAKGDYYINAPTGFIYQIVNKEGNLCTFQYIASLQTPLPDVKATELVPYVDDGSGNFIPASPQVIRTFIDDIEKTGWHLEFKLPHAPNPQASFKFIAPTEDGAVSAKITSETDWTFDFKIPRGSKLFAGIEVGPGKYDAIVEGAESGDLYINTDPLQDGQVYLLNKQGIWELQKGGLKGPPGDALNVVREYTLYISDTLIDNLENGVDYIKNHYVDDQGIPFEYKPDELFAINWINEEGKITSYWYFYTEAGEWSRVQLTSGVQNFIETVYNDEASGPVDNKTYSISYINQLIGGNIDLDNMDKTAFSKDQIYGLLSWGTWADAIAGDNIPEPENKDTLSAEEVIALMSWGSIASLTTV